MTVPQGWTVDPDAPLYQTIHWGAGPGLLVCQQCGAVVFPDPDAERDIHADWHAHFDGGKDA